MSAMKPTHSAPPDAADARDPAVPPPEPRRHPRRLSRDEQQVGATWAERGRERAADEQAAAAQANEPGDEPTRD